LFISNNLLLGIFCRVLASNLDPYHAEKTGKQGVSINFQQLAYTRGYLPETPPCAPFRWHTFDLNPDFF
jgi:hypothetical protein